MSNTKHTSGPWVIERLNSNDKDLLYITNGNGRKGEICWVEPVVFRDKMESNARLISAAPTMLQEMERYLPILEWVESMPEIWERATRGTGIATLNGYKNAIEKATK